MKESVFIEVSDILDSFDIEEISRLVKEQINGEDDPSTDSLSLVNHLWPLYYKYTKIMKNESVDPDTKEDAEDRFYKICKIFLEEIFKKFDLSLNQDWLDNHYGDIPAITLAFYSFFIVDFNMNLYQVIVNYILENGKIINDTFEILRNKKDASTLSNKKSLSPEMALIVSNIYDISDWILTQINEEEYLNLLEEDYVPLRLIKELYNQGILAGEFVSKIYEIYFNNIPLKSNIGFNIIYNIKTGNIKDIFATENK